MSGVTVVASFIDATRKIYIAFANIAVSNTNYHFWITSISVVIACCRWRKRTEWQKAACEPHQRHYHYNNIGILSGFGWKHCVATESIAVKSKHFKESSGFVSPNHSVRFSPFTVVTHSFYDALNLMASLISLVFAMPFEKCNLASTHSIAMRLPPTQTSNEKLIRHFVELHRSGKKWNAFFISIKVLSTTRWIC